MIDLYAALIEPFLLFGFMRRALVAVVALALGCAPVGVLLVLRRMSLVGDALSHAVLPGAALGFLAGGLSLPYLGIGGLLAGLIVALLSGAVSRLTSHHEDASFAAFYLISLALGVLIVSMAGSSVDLMHLLFGAILAVNNAALILVAGIATVTVVTVALLYRALIVECVDPGFLRMVNGHGSAIHFVFLALVVLNLVAGFQALGTLMAVGLMMLPAAAARFWVNQVWSLFAVAAAIAMASGYVGLLLSYYINLPSGPAIVLVAGGVYALSVIFGSRDSVRKRYPARGELADQRHQP